MQWVSGGGVPAKTRFTDTFNRLALGPLWQLGYQDPTQVGSINGTLVTLLATPPRISFTNSTGAGSAVHMNIIALVVSAIAGKAQFAESQLLVTSNSSSAGPAVLMFGENTIAGNDSNGYALVTRGGGPGAGFSVSYCNNTSTQIGALFGTQVANDLWRIAVTFQATQNTIFIFQNGVLVNTLTDNGASRPTGTSSGAPAGLPGYFFQGSSANVPVGWGSFRCGPGLT